ncbi:MAG: hypothetical protein ACFFCV_12350 [Promethearchaeota archaeon]
MILINYPITGQLRFILMILEWIFSITCLEFGILFMFRHKKKHYRYKFSQDIGYLILFFSLSFSSIFSVLGSYFTHIDAIIELHHLIRLIFLYSGFLLFIIIEELRRVFLFKKYFISTISSLIFILFIFFYFLSNVFIVVPTIIFLFLNYLFFLLFFVKIRKNSNIEHSLFFKLVTTLFPFFLLIGLFFTSDYSLNLLQTPFRFIGSLLQLFGIAFFVLFFLKYPVFSEFDLKDKIEEVFLINKNGACIFYKSYIQKSDLVDKHLVTSAITSVNIMLKEILKADTKEISLIKKKGKLIYIVPSELITGVIISKKESKLIQFYMTQLIRKVGQVYKNILRDWNGDLDIFNPISDIFKELFS